MEAASRSALDPLKDELEPLPDSAGPAAPNPSPAAPDASPSAIVDLESLTGGSDLADGPTPEPPQAATEPVLTAEQIEAARTANELLETSTAVSKALAELDQQLAALNANASSERGAAEAPQHELPQPADSAPASPPVDTDNESERAKASPGSHGAARSRTPVSSSSGPPRAVAKIAAAPRSTPSRTAKKAKASVSSASQGAASAPSIPTSQRKQGTPVPSVYPAAPSQVPQAANADASIAPPCVMDRDFIARNQIVERYLSGKLPIKGTTDFERFCHQHPELLDEIGLPERVHAGLRLLEASGKPEPWHEAKPPFWQKPAVSLGLGGLALMAGLIAFALGQHLADKNQQLEKLQRALVEQPLEPASATRTIRVLPSRVGSSSTPAVTIGGGNAQLADLRIDMSRSPFRSFRITIDRIDQGRVAILHNVYKDSNGHVRIALNSSALGPGNYAFSIDGLTWRGETVPDAWVTLGIQR